MSIPVRPSSANGSQSLIEKVLELTHLSDIDPDLFTNARPLWHPPGARGIYGGAYIAQALSAAQKTIDDNFTVHSMHCYFVMAGSADIPVIYHVDRIRSGQSFATRIVQARQRGKVIFTTTMSFVRQNSGGQRLVQHATPMPLVPHPVEGMDDLHMNNSDPVQSQKLPIENNNSHHPYSKKFRQWIKARGPISSTGGHEAHLCAVAYMSDNYFIGTVARAHQLQRYPSLPKTQTNSATQEHVVTKLLALNDAELRRVKFVDEADLQHLERLKNGEDIRNVDRDQVGMIVSLDHIIYFHNPRSFRADEWILAEMETPWSDDGRGLAYQRMYAKDGTLIASCIQEGVLRLKQMENKL